MVIQCFMIHRLQMWLCNVGRAGDIHPCGADQQADKELMAGRSRPRLPPLQITGWCDDTQRKEQSLRGSWLGFDTCGIIEREKIWLSV